MFRRLLVVACLAGWSAGLSAQTPSPSYTQMLLGVGYSYTEPMFALGFEHKPKGSKVAFRALLEHHEVQYASGSDASPSWHTRELYGAQLLGVRLFRDTRRIQPYVFGGLGLYHQRSHYAGPELVFSDTGLVLGAYRSEQTSRFTPAVVWGTGLNLRLRGVTLFGEARLPMFMGGFNRVRTGPQSPLVLGFRF